MIGIVYLLINLSTLLFDNGCSETDSQTKTVVMANSFRPS